MKQGSSDDEKAIPERGVVEPYYDTEDSLEQNEVFKKTHEGVDFRTVGWPKASIIFLKGKTITVGLYFRHANVPKSSSPRVSSVFLQQ